MSQSRNPSSRLPTPAVKILQPKMPQSARLPAPAVKILQAKMPPGLPAPRVIQRAQQYAQQDLVKAANQWLAVCQYSREQADEVERAFVNNNLANWQNIATVIQHALIDLNLHQSRVGHGSKSKQAKRNAKTDEAVRKLCARLIEHAG